jgi:hypothetical protein
MIAVLVLAAGVVVAQQTTLEIKSGQVLAVHGNELVYRGPEGVKSVQVPEDFRFDYSGQKLSVHELKPGMMVSAYIKTTKKPMPMTATEVQSGEVINASGGFVVVRRSDGEVIKFSSKTVSETGAILSRDGKGVDPNQLRVGDVISATIVTKAPPAILTEQEITAYAADPPKPPVRRKPVVVAKTEPKPVALPKTAGPLPFVALAGLVLLATGAGLTVTRRRIRK